MKTKVNDIIVNFEKDYYNILGLTKDADSSTVLAKGIELLNFFSSNDCSIKMNDKERYYSLREIREALQVLSDKDARFTYDNYNETLVGIDNLLDNIDIDENEKNKDPFVISVGDRLILDDLDSEDVEETTEEIKEETTEENDDEVKEEIVEETTEENDDEDKEEIVEETNEENDDEVKEEKAEEVKVEKAEKAEEKTIVVAKKKIDATTVAALAGIAFLASTSIFVGYNIISTNKVIKELKDSKTSRVENNINAFNEQKNANVDNSIDNVDNSVNEINENNDTNISEEENATQINEEETVEVAFDSNNEEAIQNTIDKVYAIVSQSNKANVRDTFDRDTVESLVRYTRDNSILTSEYAYNLFRTLYEGGIDLSMIFENLDSYEYMSKLNSATTKIAENNGSYDDEYAAYLAIDNALEKMNSNNYAEVWAVSVECDYSTYYSSMNIARGGAKENGEEGPEYIDEKNKVHSNIRKECSDIYNKARNDDQNSLLMQYRLNAVNNENTRTR